MIDLSHDRLVRQAAFTWLAEHTRFYGNILPRHLLAKGFIYRDHRVPLVSPQGIFKPRLIDLPLSVTTVASGPYEDRMTEEGLLHYKYRGTNPDHRDNVGLRRLMELRVPLVYFFGIEKGQYLPAWPVFVVDDNPQDLSFQIAVDDLHEAGIGWTLDRPLVMDNLAEARREYVTRAFMQRAHQGRFRAKVLAAYRRQCALCRLRHEELLDAAHIVGDKEPGGEPIVTNGIALCKLHHTAFDRYFIGITPEHRIEVRQDILEEADGPMLRHGLQGLHDQSLLLPRYRRDWPDPEKLLIRYQRFQETA